MQIPFLSSKEGSLQVIPVLLVLLVLLSGVVGTTIPAESAQVPVPSGLVLQYSPGWQSIVSSGAQELLRTPCPSCAKLKIGKRKIARDKLAKKIRIVFFCL